MAMIPSPAKVKRRNSECADENQELQQLFRACDPDHSGKIDKNELRAVMRQLNSNQEVSDTMLETIYNVMDKNGDGFIDEGEFVDALKVFKHGEKGSKKFKSNFEDFFFQFIQANTIEEELGRIQVRVQDGCDTTIDCVRFNSHTVFKSKMAEARQTDVGMYMKVLYQNVFTQLNIPEFFPKLANQLHSKNETDVVNALVMVQDLLYLPEAFVTQRERLEISQAIIKVFDGLSGLGYPQVAGQLVPIAKICALAKADNALIVLHALKCVRLYILGPRVNFSNKNNVWYPSRYSTREVMHGENIHSAVLNPCFTYIFPQWKGDREGFLQRYPNGELVLIEIVRCIGVLSEEIPPFLTFFLENGYRANLLSLLDHQKTHAANLDLTRAAFCTLAVLYGYTHEEPPALSFPAEELEKILGMCSTMIACMESTVSINNQPTKVLRPDDSVIVNISFICGIVLPTVCDPALRDVFVILVSQLVVLMQRTSWYDESGTIRHDSAANLSVVAVDECVHYILSECGPESILHRLHLMEPLFVKPPPGQPTLIDAVGQQFAGRHADSDVYDSALSLLTCLAVECGQAEQVLATFGGHLVIMLCSSERRESVLDVLLEVIRAAPGHFALVVKEYEVVEVLFGLLTRLKQRSDHPMIGVLCGDQQSVYNISMVHKCVAVLGVIAETANTRVPGTYLFASSFTLEHVTLIELLLHIFCEEIKTQRLHDQHPSWIPADGLSSDLKRLLYAIEKINERSSNNSSHVISACAKDLLERWDPALASAVKQANELSGMDITSGDLNLPPQWVDSTTPKLKVKLIPRWIKNKKEQRDGDVPVTATIEDLTRLAQHFFRIPVVIQHLTGGGSAVEGTFVQIETDHDLQRLLRAKADERDQSTPLVLYVYPQDKAIADIFEQQQRINGGGAEKDFKHLPSKDRALDEMRNNNEKLGLIIDIKVLEKFYDIFKTQGDKTDITKDSFTKAIEGLGRDPDVGAGFAQLSPNQINNMFQSFDTDGSGTISLQEMSIGMARLMVGDEDEKLRAAFRAYDTDESGTNTSSILPANSDLPYLTYYKYIIFTGTLDKEEVIQMVKVTTACKSLHMTAFIDGIFGPKDSINFEEFRDLVKGKDGLAGVLPLDSLWKNGLHIESPKKGGGGGRGGGGNPNASGRGGGRGRGGGGGYQGGRGRGGFQQNQNVGGWGSSQSGGGTGNAEWNRGGGFGGRNNNWGQQQAGGGGGRSGGGGRGGGRGGRGGNPYSNA